MERNQHCRWNMRPYFIHCLLLRLLCWFSPSILSSPLVFNYPPFTPRKKEFPFPFSLSSFFFPTLPDGFLFPPNLFFLILYCWTFSEGAERWARWRKFTMQFKKPPKRRPKSLPARPRRFVHQDHRMVWRPTSYQQFTRKRSQRRRRKKKLHTSVAIVVKNTTYRNKRENS